MFERFFKEWRISHLMKDKSITFVKTLGFILIFVFWIFLMYKFSPEKITDFFGVNSSYFLVFLLAFIATAPFYFPIPYFLLLITFAAGGLNPLILGLASGTGAMLGCSISYLAGYTGRKIIPKRYSSKLEKIHNWINHRNYAIVFSFILLYSIFAPLPSNLFMIFLGIDKLPYKKMIFPVWIGNIIFGVGIAIIGFYGLGALFV